MYMCESVCVRGWIAKERISSSASLDGIRLFGRSFFVWSSCLNRQRNLLHEPSQRLETESSGGKGPRTLAS